MRIGVIGAGHIGGTAAKLFAEAGHQVAVANSRGPSSLGGLVASLGPKARALSPEEAVKFGEVVLLAIPWRRKEELPPGERFGGRTVLEGLNPSARSGGHMALGRAT